MRINLCIVLAAVTVFYGLSAHWTRAAESDFKPVVEADLPEGFPTYTPVGEIELKDYPAYRKATSSGSTAFWALFSHIKQNNIAMTAPVEMTMDSEPDGDLQQESMAFLYGHPTLGQAGKQGSVRVEDIQAMQVASIGLRGRRTDQKIKDAEGRLRQWIEARGGLAAAGPLRVMGYNSPFVPRDRQFYEVQIPVSDVE